MRFDVSRGLEAVGNTRFITLYYAGSSTLCTLPSIKELLNNGVIEAKKDTGIAWMKNLRETRNYEDEMTQLTSVLEPLARATKCLEALQSNPADVFLFWVAMMSTERDLFDGNHISLPVEVIDQISSILDFRYNQMIEGPQQHAYLLTFYLNPRE